MAILGVLLGITMTVLAGVIWWGKREHKQLITNQFLLMDRMMAVESRKAVIAEASQPKPAGVAQRRQWSENLPAAEN